MAYLPLLTEKQTFWTSAGAIASGYKLFIYLAGTTTKTTTYQETTGTANTNPVVLNSRGEVPYGVYVAAGSTYKLVLAPSTDSDPPVAPVWTRDNLSATNDASITVDQWQASGFTPTYVSTTSFTVTGDRTSTFQVGRRVKTTNTGGTIYSTITASAYSSVTTVTVVNDSGTLDSGLSAVSIGLLTPTSPSMPLLVDTYPIVSGSSDKTKKLRFEIDGLTTATTRVNYQADEDTVVGETWGIKNLSLTATVATNALTIAVKTAGGSDASATNPINIKFRNVTAGTGTYSTVALTGALSVVVSSGSTLGTVSALPHRLWLVIFNDGGTLRLGVLNTQSYSGSVMVGITPLSDDILASSTAEGGAGAADSSGVIYTGTAVTAKAMRVIGYVESTQATAGTWATTPSKIQMWYPGIRLPGEQLQTQRALLSTVLTGTTTTAIDDTIPQNTEGFEIITRAITPISALNMLDIEFSSGMSHSSASASILSALFQDSAADAICTVAEQQGASADTLTMQQMQHTMAAGTTSSTTFRVRSGSPTAGTVTVNGVAGARRFAGVMYTSLQVTEIAGSRVLCTPRFK
jgi:hypothetical protein